MDAITAAHDGDIQMIDSTPTSRPRQNRGQITVSVDHAPAHDLDPRGRLTTMIHAAVDPQGLPIRLRLTLNRRMTGNSRTS